MARRSRFLLPGVACHVKQRGVDRRETFSSGQDRHTYLDLLRRNLEDTNVRILGWCLMSNQWQNRFFACMLAPSHLWTALAYVERNPLRAKIVRRAEDYVWSSAIAHVTGGDGSGLLDMPCSTWNGGGRLDEPIGAKC